MKSGTKPPLPPAVGAVVDGAPAERKEASWLVTESKIAAITASKPMRNLLDPASKVKSAQGMDMRAAEHADVLRILRGFLGHQFQGADEVREALDQMHASGGGFGIPRNVVDQVVRILGANE
jgi:hypothetical protein